MAVTMRLNQEHNGIELLFPDSERPDASVRTALKQHGFRWHNLGKYWFARQTPDRLSFAKDLVGPTEKTTLSETPEAPEAVSEKKQSQQKQKASAKPDNTFAAVYASIGNCKVVETGADLSVHSLSPGVYCKDLNAYFRNTWGYDDCISVTDLTNAGKTGKTCSTWRLFSQKKDSLVSNDLSNKENIETCSQLIEALRSGKKLESLTQYSSDEKGIEVFSPFLEVKPLTKLPEEWNKRNFTNALLSGQIYMGQVDYHYTDDYALDAANNFSNGVGINIPNFARDVVENWSSTNYVSGSKTDADRNTCEIHFSEHSNSSKTLYFDLKCDIREGKRRADERAAGIEAYNSMMKASCIQVPPESIQADKIYSVTVLDMSANTGIYGTLTESMQGSAILDRVLSDARYFEVLSIQEQEIVPDKLYEIASFYHPRKYDEQDDRIIEMGNEQKLVTGKALLELTAEGMSIPYIQEAYGENHSIESARESLNQFISGERRFMFTGLRSGGYEASLEKLNREAARAGHVEHTRSSVDALIAGAQNRAAKQAVAGNEKKIDISR